jgi:hypothetical protein
VEQISRVESLLAKGKIYFCIDTKS